MRGQLGHNTRPHTRLFSGNGCMVDLINDHSFDSQATWVIIKCGWPTFLTLSMGICTTWLWQTSCRLVQELNVCTVLYCIWKGIEKMYPSGPYRFAKKMRQNIHKEQPLLVVVWCLLPLLVSIWPYNCCFHWPFPCRGYFRPKHKDANTFENHISPVMLVFIGKLLQSTLWWVPICLGFSHFQHFCIFFIGQISHQQHRV